MILYLLLLLPYYKRVWNEDVEQQMEELRQELYLEYPSHPDVVDKKVDAAIERLRK